VRTRLLTIIAPFLAKRAPFASGEAAVRWSRVGWLYIYQSLDFDKTPFYETSDLSLLN